MHMKFFTDSAATPIGVRDSWKILETENFRKVLITSTPFQILQPKPECLNSLGVFVH
jgi:hypothetical protein